MAYAERLEVWSGNPVVERGCGSEEVNRQSSCSGPLADATLRPVRHFSLTRAEMGRPDLVGGDVVHLSSLLPQTLEPVGERPQAFQRFIVVCHGRYIVAILLSLQRRLQNRVEGLT
jgi:hypothetical protein